MAEKEKKHKQNEKEDDKNWDGTLLQQYQGFWYPIRVPPSAIISFQNHFKARDTDIFLLTLPKSGTTWLKALIFSIVTRHTLQSSALLVSNPHDLVPNIEINVYSSKNFDVENYGKYSSSDINIPRIIATHVPYESLPSSIMDSKCRIVYLCRNPLDQFVSQWHFVVNHMSKIKENDVKTVITPIEEAFDQFCKGINAFGPFWDHVLCHWKLSQEKPDKLLFMKYEDLKEETGTNVKKLAEFLGRGFSSEEIEKGVVEEIEKLCSFETMKNLDVNKGMASFGLKNESFFRKGKVGDWKNYITPSMADRMKQVLEDKLGGSGLKFDMF